MAWNLIMTSHLDSHWTTDDKQEMLSGVQTGNRIQHVEYNIHGIAQKKNQIYKKKANTGIAYGACTILPLQHFLTFFEGPKLNWVYATKISTPLVQPFFQYTEYYFNFFL